MAELLTCVPRVLEVWSSNPGPTKPYTTATSTQIAISLCAISRGCAP